MVNASQASTIYFSNQLRHITVVTSGTRSKTFCRRILSRTFSRRMHSFASVWILWRAAWVLRIADTQLQTHSVHPVSRSSLCKGSDLCAPCGACIANSSVLSSLPTNTPDFHLMFQMFPSTERPLNMQVSLNGVYPDDSTCIRLTTQVTCSHQHEIRSSVWRMHCS